MNEIIADTSSGSRNITLPQASGGASCDGEIKELRKDIKALKDMIVEYILLER